MVSITIWRINPWRLAEEPAEKVGERLVQRSAIWFAVPSNLQSSMIMKQMRFTGDEFSMQYKR